MTEQPMTAGDLAELVQALARQRALVDLAKSRLKMAEADLAKLPEYAVAETCRTDLRSIQAISQELEGKVRALALEVARRDGTNKPALGIEVVAKRRFEIMDRAAATSWARTNMPLTLTLDAEAFEKSVLALPAAEASAVPGVTIEMLAQGQVRISSKLQELYPQGGGGTA